MFINGRGFGKISLSTCKKSKSQFEMKVLSDRSSLSDASKNRPKYDDGAFYRARAGPCITISAAHAHNGNRYVRASSEG